MLSQPGATFHDDEDGENGAVFWSLYRGQREREEKSKRKVVQEEEKYKKTAPERQRERMIRCEKVAVEKIERNVCLFVHLFIHSPVRPSVYSLVCSFVHRSLGSFSGR